MAILDDPYSVYIDRITQMVNPEIYPSQIQNIHASAKFQYDSTGHWQPQPLLGYTVITPPSQDTDQNAEPYKTLQALQISLAQQLPPQALALLPSTSLHLTLADLICAGAYRTDLTDPNFESRLQTAIEQSFQQTESLREPISWKIVGLTTMPQGLGVCLIPKDLTAYTRILEFRRAIYQHPGLVELGIKQHYHFTAHITLGYWGDIVEIEAEYGDHPTFREHLNQVLGNLNREMFTPDTNESSPEKAFWIDRAELRQFEDLTQFHRQPDWPRLIF